MDVALAHILAVLLLRGCCPSVPRCLPPVLCGGGAGPARLDISLLTDWKLALGSCFLIRSPSAAFPWDVTVGGSCMSPYFGMLSVLFPGNIGLHFFKISRSFLSNV